MGKLGARELNYSSDIDLVLLYDPAAGIYLQGSAGDALGGFTTRMARDLVALMEARDADGYVFRTDLRLRPDPGGDAARRRVAGGASPTTKAWARTGSARR